MADEIETVGDWSRNILQNIQASAWELMRTAVQCSINARSVKDWKSSEDLPILVALKREKEGLIRECTDSSTELELREHLAAEPLESVSVSDDQESSEALRQRMKTLEEELVMARSRYHQDMLLLECVQKSECLSSHLFGKTTPAANDKLLVSMVEKQVGVASEVLHNTQEVLQLHSEISGVQRQRADSQLTCRTMMARLQALKQQQAIHTVNTPRGQRLADELKRHESECSLLRHTLQCLIAGSGVDWAGNEELLQLTLSLGLPGTGNLSLTAHTMDS